MDERTGNAIADGVDSALRQLREAPRRLFDRAVQRLPLAFRVLYRQFLLRVIDLEALSIQADVVGFLGQFAGVLLMVNFIHTAGVYFMPPFDFASAFHWEQYLISTTMLVVGLVTVVSWDATFPDRRDTMVLSPLPVASQTILLAKLAASAAVLGLAIVALNATSALMLSDILGSMPGPHLGFIPSLAAYLFTLAASSAFLYGSVLTVQGLTALLLPRRFFLRLSAILQLACFALFLGVYFMEPTIATGAALTAPENQPWLTCVPSFWFAALFSQLRGSLPPEFAGLAARAWIGLGIAVCGALVSLLLCYTRTMKMTVEEPDLVPGAGGWHWKPRVGSQLQTAIVLFSIRSLTRSRQHRLAFAFYLAIVCGIALSLGRGVLSAPGPLPLNTDLAMSTFMMMIFAVVGLRSVFSLPISLTANWILRTTQLYPTQNYVSATGTTLLLLAAAPVWLVSAILSLSFRPYGMVAAHLAILALVGCILVELCLIGFYKVPFTCSILPGKSNVQVAFWGLIIVVIPLTLMCTRLELSALAHPSEIVPLFAALGAVYLSLWAYNRQRAKSAVLYFEELPEQVIMTLGLISVRPAKNGL
jgi:hypothetical protein